MVLFDIFQSVLVPRAVSPRLRVSGWASHSLWVLWCAGSRWVRDPLRRENALATYAPFFLVFLLVMWTGLLVFGYGLMFYGLRVHLAPPYHDLAGTMYFAGTTLFTIGYGDIVPRGAPVRVLSVFTGATGFAVVAVVTTFLFSTFAAFQRREEFVLRFGSLAGAPPSGVAALESSAEIGARDSLPDLFSRAQDWSANLLETHLAYPILAYFRSNHDYQSWIATLGAILDAATLSISTIKEPCAGEARLMYRLGRELVQELVEYYELKIDGAVGVERWEFDAVMQRLEIAGFAVVEAEAAWHDFSRLRSAYASPLNLLAHYWRIPPAQWIGDRSAIAPSAGAPPKTA